MSFEETMLQECAAYFEENEKRSVRARVFDHDGRFLASALGLLDKDNPHGTFWPDAGENLEKKSDFAAVLKNAESHELLLQDFRRCAAGSNHYHFHFTT